MAACRWEKGRNVARKLQRGGSQCVRETQRRCKDDEVIMIVGYTAPAGRKTCPPTNGLRDEGIHFRDYVIIKILAQVLQSTTIQCGYFPEMVFNVIDSREVRLYINDQLRVVEMKFISVRLARSRRP